MNTIEKARELEEDEKGSKSQENLERQVDGLRQKTKVGYVTHTGEPLTKESFLNVLKKANEDAKNGSDVEGVKFDDEKVSFHLLPPLALEGTAWVFKYGGTKYAAWNHSQGMSWSKMYRAALGHTLELGMGNFEDDETKLGHVYHAICSLMMLAEGMIMHPEKNDLYPDQYKEKEALIKLHRAENKRKALDAIKQLRDKQK